MKKTLLSLMTLVFFACSFLANAQNPLPVCKLKAKFEFKTDRCYVKFADYSAAASGTTITNWYWDFGDATTSNLQHPTHTYTTAGTYTVCLTIVGINNATGLKCKDQFCLPVTVQDCGQILPCKLAAKFDFKTDGCKAAFTDYSATAAGTTILSWFWDFGDGITSTLQNPSHAYAASGTYNVCLTIIGVNAAGVKCTDKICQKIDVKNCGQIEPCKLAAKFDFKIDKCTVYFVDLSATATGTTITDWFWNFGDATSSNVQNPTHVYTAPGTYTVCLTVIGKNAAGKQCKDQFCMKVTVEGCGTTHSCGVKPLFDFKVDKCTVYFTDNSGTNPGTTINNWYWDFGDGNTSSLQHPTHAYAVNGTYTVCLTTYAINTAGEQCKNTYCFPVKVDGCEQTHPCGVKPLFDFKIDKCTVHFVDNSGTNTGTTLTGWYWTFGDGGTSNLQNPVHAYATAGTYTVCLTSYAVNAAGVECKNTYCKTITVDGCGEPQSCKVNPKFSYKTYKCDAYFNDLSTSAAGTTITNWYWDFGDGNTSTLQNPTHSYSASGTYAVCLTVVGTTASGEQCKDRYCEKINITDCAPSECLIYPKFDFKIEKCTVYFTDYSGTGAGTTITNWYWDFGDGNTSTLQNPTHVYAANGVYTVCLTIVGTNAAGQQCKDRLCLEVKVEGCGEPQPCKVNPKFSYKTYKCDAYFNDLSTSAAGTIITNWYWDFGDGNTSTLQNPTHTYSASGTYVVCLTVVGTTASGEQCKDRYCEKINITDCAPSECLIYPKFDFKIEKCTVYFTDYSGTGAGTTITNWYWDFGDGNTSTLQNPTHVYAANGVYTVCLTIVGTNAAGQQCKDRLCLEVKVDGCGEPQPCKLAAKFDYKVDRCTVYFTDYSATAVGTTITNWYWDFGDGNTSTLQNPTHIYAANGNYLVCLVIVGTNAAGQQCKDRLCLEVKVDGCGEPQPCKVAAKFDYKADGCTLYFTDYSATAPGTTITYWEWSFGDGGISYVQNPSHVYAAPGTYVVCLIIVGTNPQTGEQCKDKVCMEVIVKCEPTSKCILYPRFDYKVDKCTLAFADYSGTGTGTIITNWYWTFGDGGTSTLQNPVHTYTTSGTYEVCLVVVGKNASGEECKEQICQKVTVDCGKLGIIGNKATISSLEVYPNPAQNLVNIQFKLEATGQVNITITDIQGRILSVVQDGSMTAGFHKLNWNADVRSGLYLITIKTDSGIEQKQLMIQE